ncbi:MAG: RnfABCDGE type electron transport complex subunit G [Clostridiales bacterium]|jgi:electron transport complex protein RnfG|nr:RnfABCDGE type electron transport complex subunit G [Clostridiales bacterium]
MNKLAKPAIVLFVICVVIGAALALTYGRTKDRIAASEAEASNAARAEVLPGAEFVPVFALDAAELARLSEYPVVTELYQAQADGVLAGYVATVLAQGYGGEVTVIVGIDGTGRVAGVRVAKHSETPGLGANAAKPEFYEPFAGKAAAGKLRVVKDAADSPDEEVSAISGATITSNAVTDAVNTAAEYVLALP